MFGKGRTIQESAHSLENFDLQSALTMNQQKRSAGFEAGRFLIFLTGSNKTKQ